MRSWRPTVLSSNNSIYLLSGRELIRTRTPYQRIFIHATDDEYETAELSIDFSAKKKKRSKYLALSLSGSVFYK